MTDVYFLSLLHNYVPCLVGLSLKFDGHNEVLVTSLPSVFMEREASEIRRGRPTVALSILKVLLIILHRDFLYQCLCTYCRT